MVAWNLTGNAKVNDHTKFLGTTDKHALVIRTNNTEAARVDSSGNVGIGTKSPTTKLEVAGKLQIDAQDAIQIVGYQPFLTVTDSANNTFVQTRIQNAGGSINFFTQGGLGAGIPQMTVLNTGTVQINAQDALQIIGYQPFLTLIDSNANQPVPNAKARIQNAGGDINFFTDASLSNIPPGQQFAVPPMKINNTTNNVEVNSDLVLTGADCAEDFNVAYGEQIEPGTVVVIDSEGAVTQSREEYDKKVAGVVSGAGEYKPGMVLDRRKSAEGRKSIALLGKVYCKVDASRAPIEVGDLLTTSDTPGHAMKATDPFRAFGSVIGKALRPLREGQGLIPILIALQ
jgi:hypothetical protein